MALALVLVGAAAPPGAPAASNEGEGPIVLTNDDVERLKGAAAGQHKSSAGLIIISKPGGAKALSTPQDKQQVDPSASWQEEYYRLKALALRRAIDSGDPINFGDISAPRPPETPPRTGAIRPHSAGPSCLYGGDGLLIHAPDGVTCPQDRKQRPVASAAARGTSDRSSYDTCIYGKGGRTLHEPRGSRCNRGAVEDQ